MRVKLVAYDVNGTIFDDTEHFFDAINAVFRRYGRAPMPLAELKKKFGQPWYKLYRDVGITAPESELYATYNLAYSEHSNELMPFDGIKETLLWLRARDIKTAVVSTQQNQITVPLLWERGLRELFDDVMGGVEDKAAALRDLCEKYSFKPLEVAYVGDQEGDMHHAKRAGVRGIAFTKGIHSEERLTETDAAWLISAHSELPDLPIF